MAESRDQLPEELTRSIRSGLRLLGLGLFLSYALIVFLKLAGFYPGHMTWLGLTLAPAAIFVLLGAPFAGLLWLGPRWWLFFVPVAFCSITILYGLNVAN